MDELQKAIKKLTAEYERAKGLDFVNSPIKYALYRTWRAYETEDKRRKKNGA